MKFKLLLVPIVVGVMLGVGLSSASATPYQTGAGSLTITPKPSTGKQGVSSIRKTRKCFYVKKRRKANKAGKRKIVYRKRCVVRM